MTTHTIKVLQSASIKVEPMDALPEGFRADVVHLTAQYPGCDAVMLHLTPSQCGALIFALEHCCDLMEQRNERMAALA